MRNRSLGWGYEKTGFCYFLTSVGVTVSGLSGNVNLLAMSDLHAPPYSSPVMVVFITILRACDTGYW